MESLEGVVGVLSAWQGQQRRRPPVGRHSHRPHDAPCIEGILQAFGRRALVRRQGGRGYQTNRRRLYPCGDWCRLWEQVGRAWTAEGRCSSIPAPYDRGVGAFTAFPYSNRRC